MGRKHGFSFSLKRGASFSWKRALGVSGAKSRISRKIGVPLTKSGRRKKVKRATGCFIATVTYGGYDTTNVRFLRAFRDEILRQKFLGRLFIRCYYKIGPSLATVVDRSPAMKKASRWLLDKAIYFIETYTHLKR